MKYEMKCIVYDTLHYRLRRYRDPVFMCFLRTAATTATVVQFLSQLFNLSLHLFYFFDKERKHRNIIDGLIVLVVLISNNEVGEHFLDFMCDKPVLMFLQ